MIELRKLSIRVGHFELADISFTIPTGRYAILRGPSGAGKTTILESICGLKTPAAGSIRLGDRDVTSLAPGERGIGYVPQDLGLFPGRTVSEHLSFALRMRKIPSREIEHRVRDLAERLAIGALLQREVSHLSGGEKRRTAIGRALSFRPRYLLLDEPLTHLDAANRERLLDLLRSLHADFALTTLHVTHDRAEAESLGDMFWSLNDGAIAEPTIAPKSIRD